MPPAEEDLRDNECACLIYLFNQVARRSETPPRCALFHCQRLGSIRRRVSTRWLQLPSTKGTDRVPPSERSDRTRASVASDCAREAAGPIANDDPVLAAPPESAADSQRRAQRGKGRPQGGNCPERSRAQRRQEAAQPGKCTAHQSSHRKSRRITNTKILKYKFPDPPLLWCRRNQWPAKPALPAKPASLRYCILICTLQ